jgi:hypothetical protein
MPARRLRLTVSLVLALVATCAMASACAITGSVTGSRAWSQAASGTDGTSAVVNVNDRSGRVRDVEFDPADAVAVGGVAAVPGKPDELDVPWTAGACDVRTDIDIAGAGSGLVVTVAIQRDQSKPCDAIGIVKRLRLRLDQPIAPALVVVHQ